jgi:hypothetical protein
MKHFSFTSLLSSCQRHWLIVAVLASVVVAMVFLVLSRDPQEGEIDDILRELQSTTGADVSDFLSGALIQDPIASDESFPSLASIREKLKSIEVELLLENLPRGITLDGFIDEEDSVQEGEVKESAPDPEEINFETNEVGNVDDFQQFGEQLSAKLSKMTTQVKFGELMQSALRLLTTSLDAPSLLAREMRGVLYHPSGEVYSWAMFYKMLADRMGVNVPQQGPLWYAAYETWFHDTYPDFPLTNPADPAVKVVVLQFFGGQLPEGVYEILAEEKEEVSVPDVTVFHPNGEALNWAAFYKLLATENQAQYDEWLANWNALRQLNYRLNTTDAWYSGYERWFREMFPQYPYFEATDTVNLEIILDLFAGDLPEGVYTEPVGTTYRTVASPTFGTDLDDFIPPGPENFLLHPNGQTLSWAMFYKMLAEKQGAVLTNELTRPSEWFTPYETWFQRSYPSLPTYAPANPALPSVVSGLYGGLPNGVKLTKDQTTNPDEYSGRVLYHPNGEVLSWAIFYKMLAEQQRAVLPNDGSRPAEWFTPYEKWFRATYAYLPLYAASEAAYPEVVADLFGGLPSGVSFGSDFDADSLMARIQKLALPVVETTDSSPVAYDGSLQDGELYAKAFYGSTDEAQILYGTHGQRMTWSDLWPHIVQSESTKSEGVRAIPYSVSRPNEAPYMMWFRQYFPELPVPLMSDVVTVDEAKFFLQGTLPKGSYGVDAGTLDLLGKLSRASVTAVSPLPSTSSVGWVVDRNSDIPTYILTSPEDSSAEFQAVDRLFDIVTEFITSLGADREILEVNRELEENPSFQAFIDQLVNGADGEMSSFFELFDDPNQESLGDLQALLVEPSIPHFLESLAVLTQLFTLSESEALSPESLLLLSDEPPSVQVFEGESTFVDPDFDPLLECSQDEDGSFWDDTPGCDL